MGIVRSITEHIEVLSTGPTLDDLRAAVQTAIQLEFSTIPPYLTAFWSIKASGSVKTNIRTIFLDEMRHFGLMCNLMRALGGWPELSSPGVVPGYPGHLPGGVHPHSTIQLEGLNPATLRTFMYIEFPQLKPVVLTAGEEAEGALGGGPVLAAAGAATIGAFYQAILTAFEQMQPQPTLSPGGQIAGPLGLFVITEPAHVRQAIERIAREGEGSSDSPEDTGPNDLAHYYRFAEVSAGKKLIKNSATGRWEYTGAAVTMPDAWPVGPVPNGGYVVADVPADVGALLTEFRQLYQVMLTHLQSAWGAGDQAARDQALDDAIQAMVAMRDPALGLMEKVRPDGKHYGPDFRVV